MKFLLLSLITHQPDPVTGELLSPSDRLREVVDTAVLAEQLGFEGFAVGERHEHPFLSSSPPVVLSNIAARTSNIELWTGVTTLSLLDPVRAYEDYATLDNLSGGRLQLIIGKGNGTAQADLFHVTPDDQWDRNREGYELFRLLWENERVTWKDPSALAHRRGHGSSSAATTSDDVAWQRHEPRIRGCSSTIWRSGVLGQRHQPDRAIRRTDRVLPRQMGGIRARPSDARVGAGTAGLYVAPTSQEAVERFRPLFEQRQQFARGSGLPVVFESVEDFVERSSALVGGPQQVIDKVLRYHERLGHEVMHVTADRGGLTAAEQRASLELFQAEVAPVLRKEIQHRRPVDHRSRSSRRAGRIRDRDIRRPGNSR